MPPPVTGDALVKEVVTTQSAVTSDVEKEPFSSGMAKKVRQVVKETQPISLYVSLAVQVLKLSSLLLPRISSPCRLLVLLKL